MKKELVRKCEMEKIKCILINKQKKITHWQGDVFEGEIYDNSGILKPEIAGFLRYIIHDGSVELRQIFVDPEFRQKKLGTALVNDLFKIARKSHRDKVLIISNATEDEPFGAFCTKMGFQMTKPKTWEYEL